MLEVVVLQIEPTSYKIHTSPRSPPQPTPPDPPKRRDPPIENIRAGSPARTGKVFGCGHPYSGEGRRVYIPDLRHPAGHCQVTRSVLPEM